MSGTPIQPAEEAVEDAVGVRADGGVAVGATADASRERRWEQLAGDGRDASPAARSGSAAWPWWQRIGFRFLLVYWLLQVAPWTWFGAVPGLGGVGRIHRSVENAAVHWANDRVFHVRETLVTVNGSGDTSWAWTQLWLYLSVALLAALVWSATGRGPRAHPRLAYGLRTVLRYYVASAALGYGIIKLFALQMPFPSLSQLATPLGDLLPMRLSWMFMGYSTTYQVFAGVMELSAGLLLLHRRTVTAGLLLAAGAFLNVALINLGYDVPVKLYSLHLLAACLVLLAGDAPRLFRLFVLNRPVPGTDAWEPWFTGRRPRLAALTVKAVLVVLILVLPLQRAWGRAQGLRAATAAPPAGPFEPGVYAVTRFVRGGEEVTAADGDPERWSDVIFDSGTAGSVGTADTLFWQRYGRGYFRIRPDTALRTATVWRTSAALDSTWLFDLRYERPDARTLRLWTAVRGDSLYVELARTGRHFQLAERQFHWLSEYNR